ncbi:MAG: AMP-binding protein [Bacteroidota bacterium]
MGNDFTRRTIGAVLDHFAETQPHVDALVYAGERGPRYTYEEFRRVCNRAAKGYMRLGIRKGDHVALWANNRPEWVISQFALAKMGGVMVTVNTAYRLHELEYLLSQSDSTTLVLMEQLKEVSYLEMVYKLCPELRESAPGALNAAKFPYLKNVIVLSTHAQPGMLTWEQLLALGDEVSDAELAARQASLDPEDVTTIMYTSGTTGFPKGVMLTHTNLVADATYIGDCMNLTAEDRLCIPVPFFHCFGCVLGTLACVTHGSTMVPVEAFSPVRVLEALEKEQCTAVHGVPTMFIAELDHMAAVEAAWKEGQGRRPYSFPRLRTGIMAGSPCPIEVMKAVVDKMGARELTIAYGLTEASPVITQTRVDDPIELRVSTVGRALPNVEVKIVDIDSGRDLPPGVQGELCTRGFHVMKGYYKMPEATAEAIDKDGWLHSGDLAVMGENGYCKITGRKKDMIIRGGENIYPREIEEFLYTHPKVMDVQVVGVPDAKYGEAVAACIRLEEGQQATEEEIKQFFQGQLANYKHPRYIKFVDGYPMTASGKIQKYKLREELARELGLEDIGRIETA